MNLDQFKSEWNAMQVPSIKADDLKAMLSENRHPVLKDIRKQVSLEIFGWTTFLLCYYTMFDGQEKPVWANLLLINSICCSLIHNAAGYGFAKYLIHDRDIKASLQRYLSKIRNYAIFAVLTRLISFTGFLVFFTVNIQFTGSKYMLLAIVILLFSGQLIWLARLWLKRVDTLQKAVLSFE